MISFPPTCARDVQFTEYLLNLVPDSLAYFHGRGEDLGQGSGCRVRE